MLGADRVGAGAVFLLFAPVCAVRSVVAAFSAPLPRCPPLRLPPMSLWGAAAVRALDLASAHRCTPWVLGGLGAILCTRGFVRSGRP